MVHSTYGVTLEGDRAALDDDFEDAKVVGALVGLFALVALAVGTVPEPCALSVADQDFVGLVIDPVDDGAVLDGAWVSCGFVAVPGSASAAASLCDVLLVPRLRHPS